MTTSTEEKILERLDQIVKILSLQLVSEKNTVTDGARSLKFAGLDNKTIAEIMNIDVTVVRTLTSNLRIKKPKKSKGG
jgi:hypothetical protein